jgi:hypothetical protein
VGELQGR